MTHPGAPRPGHRPLRSISRLALSAALTTSTALGVGLVAAPALAEDNVRVSPRGRDVTIIEGEDRTVYEYRQNGQLRQIRIVPAQGRPYYLVPADQTRGYGNLEHADMLIPRWVIAEF